MTITATSAEAVKACKRQVEITVSDEPQAGDQSKSIDCPPGIVGRIIGRGGETIRYDFFCIRPSVPSVGSISMQALLVSHLQETEGPLPSAE